MSATASPPAATSPAPAVHAGELCPLCGAPLHPEQDWCLNCGAAARTRLAPSPNWKVPLTIIAVVIALSLGVLAAALVKLAGGSGTAAPPTTTTVTTPAAVSSAPTIAAPAATAPATTTTPATKTAGVGLPGGATAPGSIGATTTPSPALSAPTKTQGTKGHLLSPAIERVLGKFRHQAIK